MRGNARTIAASNYKPKNNQAGGGGPADVSIMSLNDTGNNEPTNVVCIGTTFLLTRMCVYLVNKPKPPVLYFKFVIFFLQEVEELTSQSGIAWVDRVMAILGWESALGIGIPDDLDVSHPSISLFGSVVFGLYNSALSFLV